MQKGWIKHHLSYESLCTSAANGCRVCLILRNGLLNSATEYTVLQGQANRLPELDQEIVKEIGEELLINTVRQPSQRLFLVLEYTDSRIRYFSLNYTILGGSKRPAATTRIVRWMRLSGYGI
jgi:hypothetical protein